MGDPAEVMHKDAEEGVLVARISLHNTAVKQFLAQLGPIFERFQDQRDVCDDRLKTYRNMAEVTAEHINAIAAVGATADIIIAAHDILNKHRISYHHHREAWDNMAVNPQASLVADRFGVANLGKVKIQAYQLFLELSSMLEVAKDLWALPHEDRELARRALKSLREEVEWEVAGLKNKGFTPAASAMLRTPPPFPPLPNSKALMKVEAASAAAEFSEPKPAPTPVADQAKPARFAVVSSNDHGAGSTVAMGRYQPGRIGRPRGFDGAVLVNPNPLGEPKTP